MNREILFKAKHIHAMSSNKNLDGTWIEGYLSSEEYINNGDTEVLIDKNTICQYTGLIDKNGKKIFEGDILKHENECLIKVVWNDKRYGFAVQCIKGSVLLKNCKFELWSFEPNEVEVIGNVFDNPELVEGGGVDGD